MQFGAFVPQGWRMDLTGIPVEDQWTAMLAVATTIEHAGYSSLWVYDHFHTVPEPSQEPTYEAWSLMAALAAATDTVRLGQMCTCNSYRPPAYLAKVAASVDAISDGRVEMGIGAGWYEHEYRGYGYEFAKASVRIGRLREAVEIMQRLWTEDVVDFDGKHYRLEGAICRPRPIQKPHIPFWIAGGGEKLTLNVAARYAGYTNFGQDSVDEFVHKSNVLRAHCEDVGTDFDSIVRSTNFSIVCEATEQAVAERLRWIEAHYGRHVGEERAKKIAANYRAGTPEQLVAFFEERRNAGLGYAILYFAEAAYDTTGLELFARDVIPHLA